MFLAPVLPVSRCQARYETLGRYRRGGSEQSRQYHVDGTTGCDIKIAEVWLCLTVRARGKSNEFLAQSYCFGGSLLMLLMEVISEFHSHIFS